MAPLKPVPRRSVGKISGSVPEIFPSSYRFAGTGEGLVGQPLAVMHNRLSFPAEAVRGVHPVPLTLLDGSEKTALMLGRNVAWICMCHRSKPLEGAVEPWSKEHPPEPVICPQCNRQYVVFRADENAQYAQIVEFAGAAGG